jgi:hypothetical protein
MVPAGPISGENLRLELRLLPDAEIIEQTHATGREDAESVTIPLGVPVSCRITMENTAENPTDPIVVSLRPEDGALSIHVRYLGDDEEKQNHPAEQIRTERWERQSRAILPRSMRPGEQQTLETWVFGALAIEPDRISGNRYLFDRPGLYELIAHYGVRHSASVQTADGRTSVVQVLKSNVVHVKVEDAAKWWPALRDAGIVEAIEHGFHGQDDTPVRSRLFTLIDASDQPALVGWMNRQREHSQNSNESMNEVEGDEQR